MSDPCAELATYLARTGLPYRALSPLGGAALRLHFLGSLQGRPVAWDAEIVTLQACDQAQRPGASLPRPARDWRPFIEIGGATPHGMHLRVGLAVPCIDAATVLRTLMMIRQYKRLRPGRHEFGESVTFTSP